MSGIAASTVRVEGQAVTGLTFDEARHRYTLDGVELPSVTTILKAAGLIKTGVWFTDTARDRGTAFHRAAQYLDEGDLDRRSLTDPVVLGRLRAYENFLREQQADVLAIEQLVACPVFQYAGTLDRRIRLRRTGLEYLVDFKPNPADWHRYQLAAYARITGDTRRAALYVREDGTYKFKPYDNPTDAAVFLKHRMAVGEKWRTA